MNEPSNAEPKAVYGGAVVAGLTISAALLWLIYGRSPGDGNETALAWLPGFNAACNGASALLLAMGYRAIRARRIEVHRRFMLGALTASAAFLAGYVLHHSMHGDTKFLGVGLVRPVYFTLLISHVVLSVVALPMILSTAYFALGSRFASHRRIARITLPLWLYVSVTGVLVYAFLRAYA